MKLLVILGILSVFALSIGAISNDTSKDYVAAVVEYHSFQNGTPEQNTLQNVAAYLAILERQEAKDVDIIVFPELGLNTGFPLSVPDKNETNRMTPCDDANADSVIRQISCAARNGKKYIVINLTEKSKCPDIEMQENEDDRKCEKDFVLYNTNLVFNRNGTIISRYRKYNLFNEPDMFKPKKPQLATFDTDFGVKFGHVICFDLVFHDPALRLVRESKVTDIIFPTGWYSEAPFGSSISYFQSWAHANNVNLLAAGLNHPVQSESGSGIFAGRLGPLIATVQGANTTSLLIARVPKIPHSLTEVKDASIYGKNQDIEKFNLLQEDLSRYTTVVLNMTDGIIKYNGSICNGKLCCDFDLDWVHIEFPSAPEIFGYKYRAAVYHGSRSVQGMANINVSVCAVLGCSTNELSSCGVIFKDHTNYWNSTIFTGISIKGNFLDKSNDLYMPSTLNTNLSPLPVKNFNFVKDGQTVSMNLKDRDHSDLLTFGIFGIHYNGAERMVVSSLLVILLGIFTAFLRQF